jgi:hypothetical protein
MAIIKTLKDVILLTPYFIVILLYVILNTIVHLLFGFMGYMIFIYETTIRKLCQKNQ